MMKIEINPDGTLNQVIFPQKTNASCQSHFLSLALLAKSKWDMGYDHQTLEDTLRKKIIQLSNGGSVTHEHWKEAVEQISSNNFTVKFHGAKPEHQILSKNDLLVRLGQLTSNSFPNLGIFIPSDVVGISIVDLIAGDTRRSYGGGSGSHVISVFGAGDGQVLMLNSASTMISIKAMLINADDFTPKLFGRSSQVYQVVAKQV